MTDPDPMPIRPEHSNTFYESGEFALLMEEYEHELELWKLRNPEPPAKFEGLISVIKLLAAEKPLTSPEKDDSL